MRSIQKIGIITKYRTPLATIARTRKAVLLTYKHRRPGSVRCERAEAVEVAMSAIYSHHDQNVKGLSGETSTWHHNFGQGLKIRLTAGVMVVSVSPEWHTGVTANYDASKDTEIQTKISENSGCTNYSHLPTGSQSRFGSRRFWYDQLIGE